METRREITYYTCDVFTEERFGGNQLAVIPDASALDGATMQKIANEFNFSETTFVTPPLGEGDFRVRIFTPREELPFAGHPTLGSAFVLAACGAFEVGDISPEGSKVVLLETGAGVIPVEVFGFHSGSPAGPPQAGPQVAPPQMGPSQAASPQAGSPQAGPQAAPLQMGPAFMRLTRSDIPAPQEISLSNGELARLLGLSEADIGSGGPFGFGGPGRQGGAKGELRAAKIFCGTELLMAPLQSAEAVDAALVNMEAYRCGIPQQGIRGIYVFAPQKQSSQKGNSFYARLFAPELGIGEDPATGAAAAALGRYLAHFEPQILAGSGDLGAASENYQGFEGYIDQGVKMGRASRLEFRVSGDPQGTIRVQVGGSAVMLCRGTLFV